MELILGVFITLIHYWYAMLYVLSIVENQWCLDYSVPVKYVLPCGLPHHCDIVDRRGSCPCQYDIVLCFLVK